MNYLIGSQRLARSVSLNPFINFDKATLTARFGQPYHPRAKMKVTYQGENKLKNRKKLILVTRLTFCVRFLYLAF